MTIQKIGREHVDKSVNFDIALGDEDGRVILACRTEADADELIDTLDRLGMDTQIVDDVAAVY